MRTRILTAIASMLTLPAVFSCYGVTAFDALRALPPGTEKNLARIEAREGKPVPERWHILIHDSSSENGLREYVVAAGAVVAARQLSQFAENLTSRDVIGVENVRVDSDKLAAAAEQYAVANNLTISTMNYALHKDATSAPVWQVDCLNSRGEKIGALVVSAHAGKIVSHEGFPINPSQPIAHVELASPAAAANAPPPKPAPEPAPTDPAVEQLTRAMENAGKTGSKSRDQKAPPSSSKKNGKPVAAGEKPQPQTQLDAVAESPDAAAAAQPSAGEENPPPQRKASRRNAPREVRRAEPVHPSGESATPRQGDETLEPFYEPPPRKRGWRRLLPF